MALQQFELDGQKVWIPEGWDVFRFKGRLYLRRIDERGRTYWVRDDGQALN